MRRNKPIDDFKLETFFPYLVRIYYRAVSDAVSTIYERDYDLTVSEWRAMAVLGNSEEPLSAGEIVTRSSIDKVKVSRAISGLTNKGYLERKVDEADRRKVALQLTRNGYYIFDELAAKVQELEKDLLAGLDQEEQEQLLTLMAKVRKNAESLNSQE
ncbi:MarR family transcriptional regulator [Terasakiella sp. SH-1]|uniref:MarR family winged helix-turn-helix transcriptional regulator n=1 Tax=Terasakiella sp. SH-1 TaxID=2560057 RepID=UPI001074304E|nr:MarR family transcriptional regulator [Terasakiella sp. SH-1]